MDQKALDAWIRDMGEHNRRTAVWLAEMKKILSKRKKRAMDWISVEERLPEGDWVHAVVRIRGWQLPVVAIFDRWSDGTTTWLVQDESSVKRSDITHWMPLPAPPEDVKP